MQTALQPGGLPQALRGFRRAESEVERNPRQRPATCTSGTRSRTYIQEPPFFENFAMQPGADQPKSTAPARWRSSATRSRPTTSRPPARSRKTRPPGNTCIEHGVAPADFNSYGSRRGNDRVMTRGTFANVRIKNLMVAGRRRRRDAPPARRRADAHLRRRHALPDARASPLVVFAGQEYGTGSSRDWAAKGTRLLGVKAVVAQSFERIHRSNLVGMGVLPLQFKDGDDARRRSARRHGDLRPRRPRRATSSRSRT